MIPAKLVFDTALETVALFHQHWQAESVHLPLRQSVIEAVKRHRTIVPIAAPG